MRTSTRILAFFLMLLMLVGMVPFALFAEEGDGSASTETPEEPTYANRAEEIAAWANANGGKFFFGHDFNGLDFEAKELGNSNYNVIGQGGGYNLTLAPKNDKFASVDGAIMLEGTYREDYDAANPPEGGTDPLAQFGMSQTDTVGKNIVIEVSYKGHEKGTPNGTPLLITREDLNNKGRNTYTLIKSNGTHYVTGANNLELAPISTTEFTDFTVIFKSALNTVMYYVDGELVATDKIINSPNYSLMFQGTIAIQMVRFVQAPGANRDEGIYFDDCYVYTADTPYGWEENKGFIEKVTDSLEGTSNRLVFAETFDFGDTYYQGMSGNSEKLLLGSAGAVTVNPTEIPEGATVIDIEPNTGIKGYLAGGEKFDDRYYSYVTNVFTTRTEGTQWRFYQKNNLALGCFLNAAIRRATVTSTVEDGREVLAIDQQWPISKHSHADWNMDGYVAGTSFVATVAFKRYENSRVGANLFQWRWNNMGKNQTGTAIDGSGATATDPNGKGNAYVAPMYMEGSGRVYMYDYATSETGVKVYAGQFTSTEFNTISVAYNWAENSAEIYVNGYKTATIGKMIPDSMFRFTVDGVTYQYDNISPATYPGNGGRTDFNPAMGSGANWGGYYLDDMAIYTGLTPHDYKGGETLNGWTQVGDYWRYYVNGEALRGEQTIEGVKYFFDAEGCFASEIQRDQLIDLFETINQRKSGDDLNGQITNNLKLSPTVLVQGSDPYTYLWGDIYLNGTKFNPQVEFGPNVKLGGGYAVKYNSAVKTFTKESLLATGRPEDFYTAKYTFAGKKYYDLSSYAGIEIVAYADIKNPMGYYLIVSDDNWSTSLPGYTSEWNGGFNANANKPAGYNTHISYNESGWQTNTLYFESSVMPEGAAKIGYSRYGSPDRIHSIKFTIDWGTCATDHDFTDAKVYLDNIYAFKYVPVTEIPTVGFRTAEDGTTRYYANSYDYVTGWQTIGDAEYYFYPYNGIMATGDVVIDGVGMSFDDDGKLIDNTATGWFVVDGIECLYVDGVLMTGAFTYDGVSYYASSKGEIFSEIGEIGYNYDADYVNYDYSTATNDFILSQNFNALEVGHIYGSYVKGADQTTDRIYDNKTYMNLVAKITHFTIVQRAEGDNAIEITNDGARIDPYVNINFGVTISEAKGENGLYDFTFSTSAGNEVSAFDENGNLRDLVFSYDVKLGEDWCIDTSAFLPIDYDMGTKTRKNGCNVLIRVNEQGYLYIARDKTKVLCKLSDDVYTNIAIAFHQTTKTADIYINGVLMVKDTVYNTNAYTALITEGRMFQYSENTPSTAYLDNFYTYFASAPVNATGAVAEKNGWVTEGGIQRYYENGLMRTSALQVAGEDGVVRYYYFNAKNGMCTGVANGWLDNKFYIEGELVTNQWVEDENGKYYVDEWGYALKGAKVAEGKPYYFNATTGALERGEVLEDVVTIVDIDRVLEGGDALVADYSNLRDGLMYTAKAKDGKTTYNCAGLEPTDISGYDFLTVDFWLGGSYKGEFLVLYGETETLFKLDVTETEDGTLTYTKPADGFSIYLKDRGTLSGTWKDTGKKDIAGIGNNNVWTRTLEDGTVEYYGRRWNYKYIKYKFEDFQPGWNTIYIPVSSLGGHAKNATQVQFATGGWEMNPAGTEFDKNWKNYTFSFGEVKAIKLAGYGTETLDGWVDGKLYLDSNQFATGWAEYDDCTYFLDETGVAYTGKKIVDGILYEFDDNGVLIGAVTGMETVIGGSQVYDADRNVTNWVTHEIERIYIDGYYQVGKTTLNGVMYICGEDGAIIKGQTLIVDGYLYEIDETGVATAQTKTWYTDEAGNIYYAGSGGKLTVNSSTKIDGYFYAFDENGVMIKNSFFVVNATNGSKRYFDGEGKGVLGMYDKVIVGYSEDGTALYKTAYFNTSSGLMVVPAEGTDTIVADGVTYVCDAEGFVKYESHEHIYDNACDASCSICGELREVTGHQYDAVVTAPTCTEGGYTTYTCTVCGYTYTADETEATGEHTYGEGVVTAPTCTEGGYTTYTCTVCGDTYTADETEATGHVYDNACDTDCNICGEVREITHSYDAVVTAPTCTEGGYTTYTCTVCGDTYTADETEATGEHTYGEGVVTAPTCAAGGYTTYTCTVCGDTYTADETAATGEHTYDDAMDAECNVCGETREVEELIATGKCGVDAIWKLRPDGTLVIAGTGCMFDYATVSAQPWNSYKAQITKIVVEEGIVSIARCAFYGHTAVTEVELPESLMVIEEYAFFGCTKIESMHIPANTFYIGIYGLRKVWLKNLTFGNPEGWAFFDGTEVTAENAIYNLTEDPTYYKQACLRDVTEEGEIMAGGTFGYSDEFTWSITETGRLVINGEGDMPRFNINTTPWYAYRGVIREVVIGEGITSVGRCAFHTSRSVRSISLPSTLVRIDEYAFYNMPYIKSATIPASVERIEIFAFRKCYELKNVTMECIFGWSAGDDKVSASALNVGAADMLTTISYTKVWVRDVNAEEEILDPNYIAGGACNVYTKWTLTYIDEAKTQIKLTITGNGAMPQFDKSSLPWIEHIANIVEVEVCEGVTEVGYCAFYGMDKVTKVTLPEGLVKINGYSFYNCWALESIAIPSTVESIGAQAFKCGITSAEFACRTGWTINGNVIPTDEMADPAIAASHLYNDRSYEFTRDPATVEEAPNNGWYDGKYYLDGAMVTDTAMYIGEDYYVFDAEGNYEIVASDGGHTANY